MSVKEHKKSSEFKVYASHSYGANSTFELSGTTQKIELQDGGGDLLCHIDLYLPGGTTLPTFKFFYEDDTIEDLLWIDDDDWSSLLTIADL